MTFKLPLDRDSPTTARTRAEPLPFDLPTKPKPENPKLTKYGTWKHGSRNDRYAYNHDQFVYRQQLDLADARRVGECLLRTCFGDTLKTMSTYLGVAVKREALQPIIEKFAEFVRTGGHWPRIANRDLRRIIGYALALQGWTDTARRRHYAEFEISTNRVTEIVTEGD